VHDKFGLFNDAGQRYADCVTFRIRLSQFGPIRELLARLAWYRLAAETRYVKSAAVEWCHDRTSSIGWRRSNAGPGWAV